MEVKKLLLAIAYISLAQNCFALDLTTAKQKYSYTIGTQVGQMLSAQDVGELDIDTFSAAVSDFLGNTPPRLSHTEMREALKQHYQLRQSERDQLAKQNIAKGNRFREENAARQGVTVLDSGLQFEVLRAGKGASPTTKDKVEVHYQGTLIDGTVFDSSYSRKKPTQFNLNSVVPGFKEAIVRMKPGAKWRVVMPPEMAYGEKGAGKKIAPNATLIFEIEYIGLATKPHKK
ncbi:MAG: FKBP-type peptidyl-prolyl cis-trans isomerase [Candidatus Thiodiazotropha sp. (ex Dulcina madagascariensis)]|nr:FKBP-type peptidyl-prolyl cis-trans isomerase [Candidatus Thiodiazotropha sp. (ex Dulcina madagascariensis)]MCU7925769.1 FKBP-type peptidyl-prolyl cis-trans isomerase [Candidatus Thiodiazotropha sp. (ex Dulcina madagascariensis)]